MAAMIINTTKDESGRDVYSFTSRGTEYTVIDRQDGILFEVWSNRKNVSFSCQSAVMTLKEMAARSKALSHLSEIIKATNLAAA